MPATLYIFNGSPPARTALITANAVGLSFDVHVFHGREELNTPEMLKINPQHTVPFLNDSGQIVSDSHAISAYLIEKYGKNESLYPKDLHQRAIVNQRMFYNASVIFPSLSSIISGFMKKQYKQIPKEKIEPVQDVYKTLEKYLDGRKWIAGDNVTIADFCCGTTTSSLDFLYPIDQKVYPKVDDWLNRVKKLSYFKNDEEQFEHFKKFVHGITNWN